MFSFLYLQEIKKSKILLGKAGIIKEEEEEKEVKFSIFLLHPCYYQLGKCNFAFLLNFNYFRSF